MDELVGMSRSEVCNHYGIALIKEVTDLLAQN